MLHNCGLALGVASRERLSIFLFFHFIVVSLATTRSKLFWRRVNKFCLYKMTRLIWRHFLAAVINQWIKKKGARHAINHTALHNRIIHRTVFRLIHITTTALSRTAAVISFSSSTASKYSIHILYVIARTFLRHCYHFATSLLEHSYVIATPLLHLCYVFAEPLLRHCYAIQTSSKTNST